MLRKFLYIGSLGCDSYLEQACSVQVVSTGKRRSRWSKFNDIFRMVNQTAELE